MHVRDSSRAAVLHALDLGARGIIIPDVQSVEEARRLVEYAKYYPLGARGFAFSRSAKYGFLPELKQIGDYFTATNQRTILMPQCETAGALEHIEEIAALDGIDGIVIGSPVYYAAASGQVTCFLNRLFYAGGRRMAGKAGAAVVSCRRGGAASAFDQLNKYFTISNMPVVSSQYWNQVHGNTPDEVRQDAEGLQIMRTLGENMAWLLRSLEAARAAGVPAPEYEARIGTNFIR